MGRSGNVQVSGPAEPQQPQSLSLLNTVRLRHSVTHPSSGPIVEATNGGTRADSRSDQLWRASACCFSFRLPLPPQPAYPVSLARRRPRKEPLPVDFYPLSLSTHHLSRYPPTLPLFFTACPSHGTCQGPCSRRRPAGLCTGTHSSHHPGAQIANCWG